MTEPESDRAATRHTTVDGPQGIQVGDRNLQVNFWGNAWVVIGVTALLAIGGTAAVALRPTSGRDTGTHPTGPAVLSAPARSAVPAPKNAPPVLVESVLPMKSNTGDGSFATPDPIRFSPTELADFNRIEGPIAAGLPSWYAGHHGTSVDFGVTTMTLRGNADEPVRIIDMTVLKTCEAPLTGTFFQGYSQGTGETLRIGFDLDAADPAAQELGHSSSRGLFPTGDHYFDLKNVTLKRGETETLLVGAFTKRLSCEFRLRIIVATASGAYYEDITDNGAPFRVTAKAPPAHAEAPLSGYRAVYAYTVPDGTTGSWKAADPGAVR